MKLLEVSNQGRISGEVFKMTPQYTYIKKVLKFDDELLENTFLQDGNISVVSGDGKNDDVRLPKGTKIEYPFHEVTGNFYATNTKISSFENFPNLCRFLSLGQCKQLKSLKGINKHILAIGTRYNSGYIDLSDAPIEDSILSLIKIDYLDSIYYHPTSSNELSRRLRKAISIVNKHIKDKSNSSILSAQKELIEADLDEYAEL